MFLLFMGFILFSFYVLNVISELSLNLSKNRNMESKIKMEFAFITNVQYSINVYQFTMKRE
jgi:hypothetical protein